ncbi:MAG: hypothetical protein HOQ24_12875 [Mycobacteriaceae bacterium]|nr:hypothetical protein [Mycobacteriaceae bacterium]
MAGGGVEKWEPGRLWRAWDADWVLVGQWDCKPPLDDLVEGGALTVDHPNGSRRSWLVREGELIDPATELRRIAWWPNPRLRSW